MSLLVECGNGLGLVEVQRAAASFQALELSRNEAPMLWSKHRSSCKFGSTKTIPACSTGVD